MDIFVSKSIWFTYYVSNFSQVEKFPDLLMWLEEDENASSDVEVWGYKKVCMFSRT